MFDAKLLFADKKDIKGASTDCEVIDLGQPGPDLGMLNCPKLGITVIMTTPWAGGSTPKVTFEVQHADDNGSGSAGAFTTLLSTGAMAADDTFPEAFEIPLTIQHKRYLKVKVTTTGTPTAGSATIGITDGTQKNPWYKREI